MSEIVLSKMVVVNGRRSSTGTRILAVFNLQVAGISLGGLMLVEKANGDLVVGGVKGKTHHGHELNMRITDADLRRKVAKRARFIFQSLDAKARIS